MILSYMAHIYPMKGFLKMSFSVVFFQEVRVNEFALI